MSTCWKCGNEIGFARRCPHCGASMAGTMEPSPIAPPEEPEKPGKNRKVFLALFIVIVAVALIIAVAGIAGLFGKPDSTPHSDTAQEESISPESKPLSQDERTEYWGLITTIESSGLIQATGEYADALRAEVSAMREILGKADLTHADALQAAGKMSQAFSKAMLSQSIANAKALDPSGYTPDSYAVLQAAVDYGQTVLDDPTSTYDEGKAAIENIGDSLDELVVYVPFDPANYTWPAYEDVARNPDSWTGQNVAFWGKVLQVSEGDSEIQVRVATDGGYDNVVMVAFDTDLLDMRLLEDDYVNVYGMSLGVISYTTVMGATVTIPGVWADQVELA